MDKSDNADCYHNEVLFTWKATWPQKSLNISFIETIFNERQSGKDQCDRDSMTEKRQMQYYIERRNNTETPDQMHDAMCKVTALSGFTANVLDVKERKFYAKTKKINNISKIHYVKYDYSDKSQKKFYIWQYSNIGQGKKFDIPSQPKAPKYEEKMKFYDGGENIDFVSDKKEHSATSSHEFPCTDESCNLTFQSFAKLERHLNFGYHCYKERNSTQLAMVADKWVKRFGGTVEQRSSNADKINEGRQF